MEECCKNHGEPKEEGMTDEKGKDGCCSECPDKGCDGCDCSAQNETAGCCKGDACGCENR